MDQKDKKINQPTHEEISTLARSFYEQEGCPQGRDLEHWLHAEAILKTKLQESNKTTSKKTNLKGDKISISKN
jgi:hypothetical protein